MGIFIVSRRGTPPAWNPGVPPFGAFASPSGGTGAGTIGDPWSLAHAFSGAGGAVSSITPGPDGHRTVWIRGGTYSVDAISIATVGTTGNRIVFRSYPNEVPILQAPDVTVADSSKHIVQFSASQEYSRLRGPMVLRRLQSDRTIRSGDGVRMMGVAPGIYNLIIVDNADNGVAAQQSHSGIVTIYGINALNNGWDESDRGHGHGLYLQNDGTNQMHVENCVFPPGFGNGIQIYGQAAVLDNFLVKKCIGWHNGRIGLLNTQWEKVLVAYRDDVAGIHNLTVQELLSYTGTAGRNINIAVLLGQNANDNTNFVFEDGYIVGRFTLNHDENGYVFQRNTLISGNDTILSLGTQGNVSPASLGALIELNNYFSTNGSPFSAPNGGAPSSYNLAGWQSTFGFDDAGSLTNGLPTVNKVVFNPNIHVDEWDADLGRIHVWNWETEADVPVDISAVLSAGQNYRLQNAQRPTDDEAIYEGVVGAGGIITVPIEAVTPQEPVGTGWRTPETTGVEFASFHLYRA